MGTVKKVFHNIAELADDVLAYILSVVGILFSNIIPLMQSNEAFTLDLGAWRIAGAFIISFLLIGKQEQLSPDEEGNTAKARAGRKSRFWIRMSNALAQGFMWAQLMNIAG